MNQQRYWNESALVLKRYSAGEKDRQVILFVKGVGKISAKARGAKNLTSPFVSRLSPLNVCRVLMYRASSGYWTITQCETIREFSPSTHSTQKAMIGLTMLDIIDRCSEPEHVNDSLYEVAIDTLEKLASINNEQKMEQLFSIFQVKVFEILGILPSFSHCTRCHKKIDLDKISGWDMIQITCHDCEKFNPKNHARETFDKEYLKLLNYMKKNIIESSLKISLNNKQGKDLKRMLKTLWNAQTFSLPKSFDVLESLHA